MLFMKKVENQRLHQPLISVSQVTGVLPIRLTSITYITYDMRIMRGIKRTSMIMPWSWVFYSLYSWF